MLKIIVRYCLLIVVTFCCNDLFGQGIIKIELPADSFDIGAPIDISYQLKLPSDVQIKSIDLSTLDSVANQLYGVGGFITDEYLDWVALPTSQATITGKFVDLKDLKIGRVNNEQIVTCNVSIAAYSTGVFLLSYPIVTTEPKINWQSAKLPMVCIVPPDSTGLAQTLAPIRDIVEEEATWEDYKLYFLPLLILVLLPLIWYLLARKKEQPQSAAVTYKQETRSAHEIALEALEELDRKQLWQQDKIKEYQSELTTIMRTYLSGRFGIPAMEQTTREIKQSLKSLDLHPRYIDQTLQVLQVADLVKFAKARPDISVHQQFLADARQIILDTAEKTEPS